MERERRKTRRGERIQGNVARFQTGRVNRPKSRTKEKRTARPGAKNRRSENRAVPAKRNYAKSNMISLAYILHADNDIARGTAGCSLSSCSSSIVGRLDPDGRHSNRGETPPPKILLVPFVPVLRLWPFVFLRHGFTLRARTSSGFFGFRGASRFLSNLSGSTPSLAEGSTSPLTIDGDVFSHSTNTHNFFVRAARTLGPRRQHFSLSDRNFSAASAHARSATFQRYSSIHFPSPSMLAELSRSRTFSPSSSSFREFR